ncbi:MAG: creatininase family protein [Desulfobacteraceae bacterium]|nr:creatininase family protein [Desulfobacteraceae bacterium]MBC2756728.1 creatininase family protein [Desulfobacteraceae bacterium]
MNAENSSYKQVETVLARTASLRIAYLPVGCTEQHGPILPMGTDTLVAKKLAEDLSTFRNGKDNDGIVYPGIAFSPSRSNANYPGSTTVAEDVFRSYSAEVCHSILRHSFDALVIICMHGPAEPSLIEIAFQFNQKQFELGGDVRPIIVLGVSRLSGVFQRWLGSLEGKHADYREFLLLYKVLGTDFFRPDVLTALENFSNCYGKTTLPDIDLPGMPMELRSVEGVIGAPMIDIGQAHHELADGIWGDMILDFSETVDRTFAGLRTL